MWEDSFLNSCFQLCQAWRRIQKTYDVLSCHSACISIAQIICKHSTSSFTLFVLRTQGNWRQEKAIRFKERKIAPVISNTLWQGILLNRLKIWLSGSKHLRLRETRDAFLMGDISYRGIDVRLYARDRLTEALLWGDLEIIMERSNKLNH